jgi:O-methyltransferase
LIQAVNYIEDNSIPGDIVECGVWRGGSMLAAAKIMKQRNSLQRKLFLFDTYEGMNKPIEVDVSVMGTNAVAKFNSLKTSESSSAYCDATLDDVKQTMSLSDYPDCNIIYKKGMVENTLPCNEINRIALLRLDTDWYESTKHELVHLYDKVVSGGVLIIDDYGYWKGAKKAVDEFFQERGLRVFMGRIDATGRVAVKP